MNQTRISDALNLEAMGKMQSWAARNPRLLAQEMAEMGEHFPHWQPAVYHDKGLLTCECGSALTFRGARDGGPRCTGCGGTRLVEARMKVQLAWVGYLPTLLSSPLAWTVGARLHPSHELITVNGKQWLLAPVLFRYPEGWPDTPPQVQYDPHLLPMLGLSSGANVHTIGDTLCLYDGHWRAVTARVVLQQRVVNHLAALVRIADGTPPAEAFIGPAHNYDERSYWDR
jgi:hypothetical protein